MTAILALEAFMKDVRAGQPLHRSQLGQDEVRPVTREINPQKLQLSLELTKARTYEVAAKLSGPAPTMAPSYGPGGTMGGSTVAMPHLTIHNPVPPPPKGSSES